MTIPIDLDSAGVFGATGLEFMQLFTDLLRGKRSLGDIVLLRSRSGS